VLTLFSNGAWAQDPPAQIAWSLLAPVPALGLAGLALLGIALLAVGSWQIIRRRSTVKGLLLLPLLAGTLVLDRASPGLIETVQALVPVTVLTESPQPLAAGSNTVRNDFQAPVSIDALIDGSCTIDQASASEPKCAAGLTLAPGDSCDVNVACNNGIVPGSTESVRSPEGIDGTGFIDLRCLEWDGDECIRPQARMPATTCPTYEDADSWHDLAYANAPEQRVCPIFCRAVTASGTVVSCADGTTETTTTANGNHGYGWSGSETGCVSSGDARWRIDYPQQTGQLNLSFSDTYVGSNRLRVECDWD